MISRSNFGDRWPLVKLGDVVEFLDHKRRPIKEGDRKAGPVPYYGANGLQGWIEGHLFDEPLVLLAEDGGHFGIPGRTIAYRIEGKSWVNNHAHVLRPRTNIDGRYLTRLLEQYDVTPFITGSTRAKLTKGAASEIEIPLPPTLDEQKRIAAVLDKADTLRRQRQESLQLTEKFLQSVFIDMFVRNPDAANWTPRSVEWMAKDTKGSMRTGPFGSQLLHSEFVDSGIAVLGIDNAVKNRFEWEQPRFITPKKYESLKRYKVFPGDLIITIMGTLGRCAIVPDDIPEAINTKHLCCITLDHKKCLPEFLHAAFLHHPDVLRQLGVRSKGAVMPGLNMGIIKELVVPVPPVELQKEFKRIVDLCTASRLDLESSHQSADDLFASLQQRAFKGQLDLSKLVLEEGVESARKIKYSINNPWSDPVRSKIERFPILGKPFPSLGGSIWHNDPVLKLFNKDFPVSIGIVLASLGGAPPLKPPVSFDQIATASKGQGGGQSTSNITSLPHMYPPEETNEPQLSPSEYNVLKEAIYAHLEKGTLKQEFPENSVEIKFTPV